MEEKIKKVNKILKKGEPKNITEDKTRGFSSTGYDPQYIIDAMNKVFGIEGWGFEDLYNKTFENETVAKIRAWLSVGDNEVSRTAYGSKKILEKTWLGDAKKSAQTDAIKKALSYFSIGNRAYHGRLKKSDKKGY